MEFEISEFKEQYRIELRQLYADVRRDTFGWESEQRQDQDTFDQDTEGEDVIVARVGEQVVGFISVWMPDHFIHHLYIRRQYQGKGLGTRLINAVRSRTKGCPLTLKCMESNTMAVKFYEKNGWKVRSKGLSGHDIFIEFELS